jgi:hypothetical protein
MRQRNFLNLTCDCGLSLLKDIVCSGQNRTMDVSDTLVICRKATTYPLVIFAMDWRGEASVMYGKG